MLESRRTRHPDVSLYQGDTITEDGLHQGWLGRIEATYRHDLDAFVRAVLSKCQPHATLAKGLRARAIAEAAVRSVSEDQPVEMP